MIISSDISKYQSLQEDCSLFEGILQQMPGLVWLLDANGYYKKVFTSSEKFFAAPNKDLLGKTIHDILPLELAEKFQKIIYQVLATGKSTKQEFSLKSIQGKECYFSAEVIKIIHKEEQFALWVSHDVTSHKRTQKKLLSQNRELQDFTNIVAHDLKAPLRKALTLGSRLQSLAKNKLEGNAACYLERMLQTAEDMQQLVTDLLTFCRIDNLGTLSKIPLEEICQNVLSELKERVEEVGAQIVLKIPEDTYFEGDYTKIRQLLLNILLNSLKYHHPQRTPEILIQAKKFPNKVIFSVQDNGIGFSPQYSEKIFMIFQRLETRAKYEGSGIGLAICKKTIEQHNGTITAEGTEDQGATFTIELPLKQAMSFY